MNQTKYCQLKHIRSVQKTNTSGQRNHNKLHLRASGLSLLPLALRPGLLLVFLVLGFCFVLQNSYVNNVSASSLTLTIPNSISLDINPSSNSGLSKSDKSTLSVKTDANYGYNLSIKVKDNTNSNSLVNGVNKLTSISSPLSEEQFNTATDNNVWGYLPSKFNSNDNTNFQPGPTDSDSTLDKTSAPNAETTNNYDIILGVKTDNNLMSGTYKNTFVLTASANTVSYTITYNLNSGSWNGTSPKTGSTIDKTIKLDSATPTRSGYEFKGWCSKETSDENCNGGEVYTPGQEYTLTNGTNDLNLWAMWKLDVIGFEQAFANAGKSKSSSYYKMQDMTASICNSVTAPSDDSTATLIDTRDSKTYTVAKLKDGRCWMTKNLEIAGKNLTSTDSDVASGFNLPASSISGFSSFDVANVYVHSTYGGYYTWYAATAREGTYSKSSGDTSHSICPKGWKLPSESEYSNLVTKQGSAKITQSPANFMLGGWYNDGSASNLGSYGRYWSSTASNDYVADNLYVNSDSAGTSGNYKSDGFSVRCVARQ